MGVYMPDMECSLCKRKLAHDMQTIHVEGATDRADGYYCMACDAHVRRRTDYRLLRLYQRVEDLEQRVGILEGRGT